MKGEHVKGRRNLGNGLPNRADLFPSSAAGQAQRPNRFFLIAYGTPRLIDGGGANGGLPPTAADLGTMQDGPQSTRPKAMSQPRQFAATIAVRVGDLPTAQRSEPIGRSQ